jgi:hypothetical protein
MDKHNIAGDIFFATPKQIKDWHNYMYNSNVWIHRLFEIGKSHLDNIQNAYRCTLEKHQILRSGFRKDENKGIIRKVLPIDDHSFKVRIYNYLDEKELSKIDHEISNELSETRMDMLTPLTLLIAYVNREGEIRIRVAIHHIICNGSSFEKLLRDLFYFYDNKLEENYSRQFQDYAKNNFELHRTKFKENYLFLKNHFSAFESPIVGEPKVYDFDNEEIFNNTLSNESYYVSTLTPEERVCETGAAINKVMFLPDFDLFRLKLAARNLYISSIAFASFSIVMQSAFPPNRRYFGALFDDFNSYTEGIIGDFTGDIFFDANFVTSLSVGDLVKIQDQVFELYKHPIFNFNIYSINEKQLFGTNCPAFLNFNVYETEFDPNNSSIDIYEKVTFSGVGLLPGVDIYKNGFVVVRWQFDELKYSKKQIEEMDRVWKESINICCRNIEIGL